MAAKPLEPVVAYRGNQRWTRSFEPTPIQQPAINKTRLRERGVYFITGGMGGIGLTLAGFLAQTVKARLALVGRSGFPAKGEWESWLATHEQSDSVSRKIRRLRELEEAGAELLVLKSDVTDPGELKQALQDTVRQFGAVHGVIHAAGVSPGGMIQMKTPEAAASVLDPKVKGTLALCEALEDHRLDFFLLCSSLTAVTGGLGMVDHSGANAFLDAFAHRSSLDSERPTISVNWDAWLEVGQAANAELSDGLKAILQSGNGSRVEHPLVEKCLARTPTEETFLTEFSTEKHWVLDEHRIMGKGVIPGVAYLEMVRKAFEGRANSDDVIIKNVLFMKPLVVEDGQEQEAYITIKRNGEGFEFLIASRPSLDDRETQEHVKGSIYHKAPEPTRRHNLDEIIQRCEVRRISSGAGSEGRSTSGGDGSKQPHVTFGRRWQNLYKKIYVGNNEALAELELPEEFSADLDTFVLHPSLMDAATGFVQIVGDGFYLPMAYGKVDIKRPLQRRIYSYVRSKDR